jgi:uncharacterized Zn finger protein
MVILGVKCQSCSRFYPEREIMRLGESMTRCYKCHEKHLAALDVLAGNPPKACGECGITFDELANLNAGAQVPMYVHAKDGVYQLLCGACDAEYVQKRRDLYGNTAFGVSRGL